MVSNVHRVVRSVIHGVFRLGHECWNVANAAARSNIFLIEPVDYLSFVELLRRCYLVLTDSGGIQEEAPALGKPVVVMRATTERPEALLAGTVELAGSDEEQIVCVVSRLLVDRVRYQRMSRGSTAYGDGQAANRIAIHISEFLENHEKCAGDQRRR